MFKYVFIVYLMSHSTNQQVLTIESPVEFPTVHHCHKAAKQLEFTDLTKQVSNGQYRIEVRGECRRVYDI